MNADLEIEREGSVSLARRGEQAGDGTWRSRTVLEDAPHDQITLGLSWNSEDCIRLRMDAYHVEAGAGDEAWHINLRLALSRGEARALMMWLSFALSQGDEP
jgi:hypothetical protein